MKGSLCRPLVATVENICAPSGEVCADVLCPAAEESQGELEVKDPCACDSLVEFQHATMSSLEQLAQKHILPPHS